MNLILIFESDYVGTQRVCLKGRRFEHVHSVLKVKVGDQLSVGMLNGQMGQGTVTAIDADVLEMDIHLNQPPPLALPVTLIIPMIRPPMFKRLLFHAATLGIKKIIVLNFSRVEKSLWQSSALRPEGIEEQLILGLEQAKDTILPQVILKDRFKPFVQDELPALAQETLKLVAHPQSNHPCPCAGNQAVTLVIGPEGGLVPYELSALTALEFAAINLGPRILRVDTALPYIIGNISKNS